MDNEFRFWVWFLVSMNFMTLMYVTRNYEIVNLIFICMCWMVVFFLLMLYDIFNKQIKEVLLWLRLLIRGLPR
jgi:hypothetical protein